MKMLREFLVGFRRFRTAGVLNLAGMSVAFAVLLLICIQLVFEAGYDRCYNKAARIFRVEVHFPPAGQYLAISPDVTGSLVKGQCPEVEDYFILSPCGSRHFTEVTGEKAGNILSASLTAVTASVTGILDFDPVEGDIRKTLEAPGLLLLPQSVVRKWFGTGTALGKTVKDRDGQVYTVGAVYRDFPENTVFGNPCYTGYREDLNGGGVSNQTYVLVSENGGGALQEKVSRIDAGLLGSMFAGGKGLRISPLTGIYFDNETAYDLPVKGSRQTTGVLAFIALAIVGIALVNFVNFSVASAPARIRELNTRKVLGASVKTLQIRLIGEAVLYAFTAYIVALGIVHVLSFTAIADWFTADLTLKNRPVLIGLIGLWAIACGIMAGAGPARYMTSFAPALVLKGNPIMSPKGVIFRNVLTSFQFIVSISLIICILFVLSQQRFLQHFPVGFRKDNIAWIKVEGEWEKHPQLLGEELKKVAGVAGYALSDWVPGEEILTRTVFEEGEKRLPLDVWRVSPGFLDILEIPLRQGENLLMERSFNQFVVNECMAQQLPELADRIGQEWPGMGRLQGITEDIHCLSLRQSVSPLALVCTSEQSYRYIFLKLSSPSVLNAVKEKLTGLDNGFPFELKFLDDSLQSYYEAEERLLQVLTALGFVAIVLALAGVYGMVLFTAQYKRKEIGIRKVNGAMEGEILLLLNRGFFRLLLFSFGFACPLAGYAMSRWLEGFCYKTPMYWWIFLLAGLSTLVIALVTISWQSWKAATENPVKALKSE